MKKQIEKLQEVIKMICNTIMQEESVRKEVENQLEKIEKEVETNNNDITNTNSNNEDKTNEKEAENDNNDRVQKVGKVRRYPQSQQSNVSGDIENCVQWVKDMNNNIKANKKSKPNE